MLFFNSLPCKLDKSISLTGSAIFFWSPPGSTSTVDPKNGTVGNLEDMWYIDDLVGGFKHFYFPFHIWDVILPSDELIFFRGFFCLHHQPVTALRCTSQDFSTRKILRFNFCPCPSHSRQLRWSTKGKERCSRHILLRLSWKGNLQQR